MLFRRLMWTVALVLLVVFLVHGLEIFLPGDPAANLAGRDATPQRVEEVRHELNLDEPLIVRYGEWVINAGQGDLGRSLFTKRTVTSELQARWAVTVSLVAGSLLVAVVIGLPIGFVAARFHRRALDRVLGFLTTLGIALPSFVVGIALVVVFAVWLKVLPVAGYVSPSDGGFVEYARHLVLPVVALSGLLTAEIARQLRAALVESMAKGYTRTATAKGLSTTKVMLSHCLRDAISPVIAVASVQVTRLLGGAILVEEIFSLPGLGQLTALSISNRDLPVILGIVAIAALVSSVAAFGSDALHLRLNPSTREVS